MKPKIHKAKEDETSWRLGSGYEDGHGCGAGTMTGDCSIPGDGFWGNAVIRKQGSGTNVGAGSNSGSGRGHG